ncbi:MAG: hypothetical protein GVY11_07330 [Gammaproteobacteria bacterium]|jgi:uncharacterized membrane protein SpoIIM required for sporulation|nr:hypothetical protein [Gammaproteobacteria bacterium]
MQAEVLIPAWIAGGVALLLLGWMAVRAVRRRDGESSTRARTNLFCWGFGIGYMLPVLLFGVSRIAAPLIKSVFGLHA